MSIVLFLKKIKIKTSLYLNLICFPEDLPNKE